MSLRARVAGVDFSGARDAGRHIWVAEGETTPRGVKIDRVTRADALPGGGADFAPAMEALVAHVAALADAVVGFDFPFSLPRPLIRQRQWTRFVRDFADSYTEPAAFRDACRAQTGGRELKRRTDADARVPWCAYNLRLHRQTWAGIAHVLWPLVRDDRARVVPMQEVAPEKPVIAEICPASLLKREVLYVPYKGRGDKAKAGRADILRALIARGVLMQPPARLRATLLDDIGGDALDAVLAMAGAARVDDPLPRDALDRIEARIYF